MALTKKYLKTKPVCKVTFEIDSSSANQIFVAGDFNNWKETDLALKKQKNGSFKLSINLATDNKYEFRYIIDGNWANERDADEYQQNEFGSENSVLYT